MPNLAVIYGSLIVFIYFFEVQYIIGANENVERECLKPKTHFAWESEFSLSCFVLLKI